VLDQEQRSRKVLQLAMFTLLTTCAGCLLWSKGATWLGIHWWLFGVGVCFFVTLILLTEWWMYHTKTGELVADPLERTLRILFHAFAFKDEVDSAELRTTLWELGSSRPELIAFFTGFAELRAITHFPEVDTTEKEECFEYLRANDSLVRSLYDISSQ
jgi:hypothetical protein